MFRNNSPLSRYFVAGDTAHCADGKGKPLPGVASVAKQQGEYIARLLINRAHGRDLPGFRYRDLGMMATIGRKRAVAQVGPLRLTGFVAWLVWCVAHIYFLIGFRNRLSVAMNWLWSYLTFQHGTRLITGLSGSRMDRHRASARWWAIVDLSAYYFKAASAGSGLPSKSADAELVLGSHALRSNHY